MLLQCSYTRVIGCALYNVARCFNEMLRALSLALTLIDVYTKKEKYISRSFDRLILIPLPVKLYDIRSSETYDKHFKDNFGFIN